MTEPKRSNPPRILRDIQAKSGRQSKLLQIKGKIPPGATPIGRLQYVWQSFPFDAEVVAQGMKFSKNGLFFCDSTVFIAPTSHLIWRAMTEGNKVALIPRIIGEISTWLEDSSTTNREARAQAKAALGGDRNSGIQIIVEPAQKWISEAIWYYADLLGGRKVMWHIAEDDLNKRLGRMPTGQEVSNHIQLIGTSRAQLLAKQGRNPKVLSNLYNDEWLVATAVGYAITSGIEVTLVTGDEAVLDQFAKAASIITRHYEAMHLAERYVQSPRSFVANRICNPDKELFVDDEIELVKSPYTSILEVLPTTYHPVQIHCMLLQSTVTRCTFQAEIEMAEVFRTKHLTAGLSTSHLDGRNIHPDPPTVVHAEHHDVAVIAKDITVDAGGPIPVALTDIELALQNGEDVVDIRWVDPNVIQLPPGFSEK